MSFVLELQGLENRPAADGGADSFTSTFSVALCGSSLSLSFCLVPEAN
jgi:hypothetical protein